jgi:hypothetical protein
MRENIKDNIFNLLQKRKNLRYYVRKVQKTKSYTFDFQNTKKHQLIYRNLRILIPYTLKKNSSCETVPLKVCGRRPFNRHAKNRKGDLPLSAALGCQYPSTT